MFLNVSRIKCKFCGHVFNDETDLVSKSNNISRIDKLSILIELKKDLSFKEIASRYNVSTQSVINIFDEMIDDKRLKLSEVMCFDEFKNLKSESGKYAFLIYSPIDHKIIDILKDRKINTLKNYFYKIDYEERLNVKYIITDMYEGYRTIINLCFPNATHIVDSFHYVRYITNAFNDVRIRIMNGLNKDTGEYKMLKNYWKILLKYSKDLNYYHQKQLYNYIEKRYSSITCLIDSSLNINEELAEAYQVKEMFLRDFKSIKYEEAKDFLFKLITYLRNSKIKEFKELLSMFCGWENEIINSFIRFGDKRLNNGYIEGMNNHIKVIKRISYGYRNFYRFRKRLMYIINDEIKLK